MPTATKSKSKYAAVFEKLKGFQANQEVYFTPPRGVDRDTALNRLAMAVRRAVKARSGYKFSFYNADDGTIAIYLKKKD